MADDKSKTDSLDHTRVAGSQAYEVSVPHAADQVSAEQARDLIKRFGNDRETLVREARKLDR